MQVESKKHLMALKKKEVPIIELVAGRGGLEEGVSFLKNSYQSNLSIEKENNAPLSPELKRFTGQRNDRIGVQLPGEAATIVTSHVSKYGHYLMRCEPDLCQSVIVLKAARIKMIPDNYLYYGPRTAHLYQLGDAFMPYLVFLRCTSCRRNLRKSDKL